MATPTTLIGVKVGSERSSFTKDGKRTYSATYWVDTANPSISGVMVRDGTAGLPKVGQRCPYETGAFCTAVRPQRNGNSQTLYEVHCTWESPDKPDEKGRPPWEQPPVADWGAVPVEAYQEFDLDGHYFEDKAGTPFNPPPSIPYSNQVLTITRNELIYSRAAAEKYGNTINDPDWFGFPTFAVLAAMPTASGHWHKEGPKGKSTYYWQVTYRFEIECGWFWNPYANGDNGAAEKRLWFPFDVPNIGPMAIPESGGEPVRCKDRYGDPLSIHQKLDEDGHQQKHDFRTMYVPFRRYRTSNFNDSAFVGWMTEP